MAAARLNPPAARLLALVTVGGVILSLALTVIAHLNPHPDLDPLSLTISDYAGTSRRGAMEAAMFVLGAASLGLPLGLVAARAPVGRLTTLLLLVWCLGLIASAIIPTDPLDAEHMSTSGYVHRYVSVAAFVALPVAGLLMVRRLRADARWHGAVQRIRSLVWASGIGLLTFWYVAFPGDRVMMGLVQRLLVGVELALLSVVALRLYRISRHDTR